MRLLRPRFARPRNDTKCYSGQTMMEFSFSMIIIVVLLLGLIRVFVWSGKDLLNRRRAHEAILVEGTNTEQQLRPVFYYSTRFNATVDSSIYGQ